MKTFKSMSCAGGPSIYEELGSYMKMCRELIESVQYLVERIEKLISIMAPDVQDSKTTEGDQKEMMAYTE